jgi:hypothetical protein
MEIPVVNRVTIPAYKLLGRKGKIGSVHSIFERSLNLIIAGRLVHLQLEREFNSPFSIELEGISIQGIKGKIKEKYPVFKGDSHINIGIKDWIKYNPTNFYDPRLCIIEEKLELKIDQVNKILKEEIQSFKKKISFNSCLVETESIIIEETESLLEYLKKFNSHSEIFEKFSRKLVGLGPGLTPLGDDFLVGMLAILTSYQGVSYKVKDILYKFRSSIALYLKNTCIVSREFLKYALESSFSEKLNNLITFISYPRSNEEELRWAIRKVLSFGATSGIGTLMGIKEGIKIIYTLLY